MNQSARILESCGHLAISPIIGIEAGLSFTPWIVALVKTFIFTKRNLFFCQISFLFAIVREEAKCVFSMDGDASGGLPSP